MPNIGLSRPLHGHRSVLKKVDEHDPLFEDLADPIQVDIIIPLSGKVNSSFCRKPLPDHFQPIPDYSRPTIRDVRLRMKLDTMDR